MKTSLALLLFVLLGFSQAGASLVKTEVSNEEFIQGAWRHDGKSGTHGYYLEWTFDKGKFTLNGYPPLHQEGSYRVVKTEGNKMTLELYDQQGNFGTESSQIEVVVNKRKGTLMIKGQGPFKRVKSQTEVKPRK